MEQLKKKGFFFLTALDYIAKPGVAQCVFQRKMLIAFVSIVTSDSWDPSHTGKVKQGLQMSLKVLYSLF